MPEWPRHLNEEVRQHLDDRYAELRAAGAPDADATRLVLAELEGARHRDLAEPSSTGLLRALGGDMRFAFRMIRKKPAFNAVVMLTLALGVGASTAMFTVVNAVLLRPLPFKDPDALVRVYQTYPVPSNPGGLEGVSPADMFALREHNRSFESVATYRVQTDPFVFGDGDRLEPVYGAFVSEDFFDVLGVSPLGGQTFQKGDGLPTAPFKVVVSYSFWQRRLHGDPGVIGHPLRLVGLSPPIVAVMPEGFWFPRSDRSEIWVIERQGPPTRQGPWFFNGIGRVRAGVSPAQVQQDLDGVADRVRAKFPGGSAPWTLVTRSLKERLVGDMRQVLLLLFAAVGLVLLIACVNVMNLLLSQATVREREIAIRVALGASRARIIGQLLTESLVLSGVAVGIGLVAARWGTAALIGLAPDNLPLVRDLHVGQDARAVMFAALIGVATSVVFGLAPAFAGLLSAPIAAMNESGRGISPGGARRRLLGALVIGEFALSLILLVGAGLVGRSLLALQAVQPGVRPARVLAVTLTTTPGANTDEFFDRLLPAVRALPGVVSATVSDSLPPDGLQQASDFIVEGHPPPAGEAAPIGEFLNVGTDYFSTLGIPVLRGRIIDERDTAQSPPAVVINDTLARTMFGPDDPIGRQLRISGNFVATITGVVGDVKYQGLDKTGGLTMYAIYRGGAPRTMALIVRAANEPEDLLPSLRAAVHQIDPGVPLTHVRTLDALMAESVGWPRFRTTLLLLFAGVALVLAAVGIYGVLMYSVMQRTHEMGVRLALGAQSRDILRLVVGEGLRLAVAGIAIGAVGAFAVMRTVNSLLFGIAPTDPLTFTAISILLVVVALVACWIPARRATRADPLMALRSE